MEQPAVQDDDEQEQGPCWSKLPAAAMLLVLEHVSSLDDLVSVGQTCQSWRAVAKMVSVWKSRNLLYSHMWEFLRDLDLPRHNALRHRDARPFTRIIRFAPALNWVRTGEVMLPAARKALCESKIKFFGVELNGRLAWSAKFLGMKEDGLEEVTLINPSLNCLVAALRCKDLRSLQFKFSQDAKYQCPSLPSDTPIERVKPLKGLISSGGPFTAALSTLVQRFGSTLEEVHVACLPSAAALAACPRLRTLGVNLDPASAKDKKELLAGLQGKKLDFIGFKEVNSWDRHDKKLCEAFRKELKKFTSGEVLCRMCA
ncbi:Putative F-box protein [Frankliniella fusca]|uniref:F-box protein n=1 Tax=Frankliniella fusca TaxID=407009 RepID=A0AAE1I2I6_9NEOP|nr:Putative F-box protein [Frankliniella fusca]